MKKLIIRIENNLEKAQSFFTDAAIDGLEYKPSELKWSRKEILGHLVDSGINNLQRFTEIQYMPKPYKLRQYDQNALVRINDYQNGNLSDILELWLGLNIQIMSVISLMNEKTLKYEVVLEQQTVNLEYLVRDYVDHMEHHFKQIFEQKSIQADD